VTDEKNPERISIHPNAITGKPGFKEMRLKVEFILNLLAHGATSQDFFAEFKGFIKNEIRACILFASKTLEGTIFMPLKAETA
jgi:uncharacterized protein (DUF433 family)